MEKEQGGNRREEREEERERKKAGKPALYQFTTLANAESVLKNDETMTALH